MTSVEEVGDIRRLNGHEQKPSIVLRLYRSHLAVFSIESFMTAHEDWKRRSGL